MPRKSDKNSADEAARKAAQATQALAQTIVGLVTAKIDRKALQSLVSNLKSNVRITRHGPTLSGKSLSDLLFLIAPRIPVRTLETLQETYGGMSGIALAGQIIRAASRHSAAVGGFTGAIASVGELAPPFWMTLPVEIIAETLVVAAIEMRLVAELHTIYGHEISGTSDDRSRSILYAWAEGRKVSPNDILREGGLNNASGRSARKRLSRMVRRHFLSRLTKNLASLTPLLIGAVVGAESNRRATRDLGDAIVRDLAKSA